MPYGDPDRNREETRRRAKVRRATRKRQLNVEVEPEILGAFDRIRERWNLPSRAALIERFVQLHIDKP